MGKHHLFLWLNRKRKEIKKYTVSKELPDQWNKKAGGDIDKRMTKIDKIA